MSSHWLEAQVGEDLRYRLLEETDEHCGAGSKGRQMVSILSFCIKT